MMNYTSDNMFIYCGCGKHTVNYYDNNFKEYISSNSYDIRLGEKQYYHLLTENPSKTD